MWNEKKVARFKFDKQKQKRMHSIRETTFTSRCFFGNKYIQSYHEWQRDSTSRNHRWLFKTIIEHAYRGFQHSVFKMIKWQNCDATYAWKIEHTAVRFSRCMFNMNVENDDPVHWNFCPIPKHCTSREGRNDYPLALLELSGTNRLLKWLDEKTNDMAYQSSTREGLRSLQQRFAL